MTDETNDDKPARSRWRKHAMTVAIVIFAGLFILGQARGVWLPFWIVATAGSAAFAIYMITAAVLEARATTRSAKAWAETALLTAIAAYSFWISIGHLTEELAHI